MISSTEAEKVFEKTQNSFMIKKNLRKLGVPWKFLKLINGIYEKPIANMIFISELLTASSL